jgi:hypothetical protein
MPSEGARTKVRDYMEPPIQDYIQNAPFAILATSNAEGRCDASPKGGKPGFVRVLDDRHLLLPDVAGNRLFQSYGNVESNPHVGLIFFIPGLDNTVRVNGSAQVVGRDELERRDMGLEVYQPDDNAKHLQGLLIEVEEAYGHCPRALKFSNLWDIETIESHKRTPPVPKRS